MNVSSRGSLFKPCGVGKTVEGPGPNKRQIGVRVRVASMHERRELQTSYAPSAATCSSAVVRMVQSVSESD
jgi:hypothetical protein